jgi:hypothetical protein
MNKPTYRERLSANAEDFDAIVSEILSEFDALNLVPKPSKKKMALIAATIKVCQEVAAPHLTATPLKEHLAGLTPENVLAQLKGK